MGHIVVGVVVVGVVVVGLSCNTICLAAVPPMLREFGDMHLYTILGTVDWRCNLVLYMVTFTCGIRSKKELEK